MKLNELTINLINGMGALLAYPYCKLFSSDPFIKSYGADFTIPILGNTLMNNISSNIYVNAITPTLIASGFELLQKVNLWPGTYDQNDFLAYGLGGILALTSNYISKKISKIDLKESQLLEDKI